MLEDVNMLAVWMEILTVIATRPVQDDTRPRHVRIVAGLTTLCTAAQLIWGGTMQVIGDVDCNFFNFLISLVAM